MAVPETVPLCCQSLLGSGFLGGDRRRSRNAGRHGLHAALYHAEVHLRVQPEIILQGLALALFVAGATMERPREQVLF
jgi:hypothetical protein